MMCLQFNNNILLEPDMYLIAQIVVYKKEIMRLDFGANHQIITTFCTSSSISFD